jgi:seryl-tRNA synthetase
MLELELVRWVMQKVAGKGFTPMTTPDLVRTGVVDACGFQARGEHSQVQTVPDSPPGSDLKDIVALSLAFSAGVRH